jgi:hypothetical protein
MTRRERRLAMALGATVAVALLYQLTSALIIGPIRTMDKGIESSRRTAGELRGKLDTARDERELWVQFATRAIGTEDNQAEARVWLDNKIKDLVQDAGLAKLSLSPGQARRVKKTQLITLPWTVTAEGTLQAVTRFLHHFYMLPFHVKITGLELTNRGRQAEGSVRMEAKIEALIMPTGEGLPPVAPADLNPEKWPPPHKELLPGEMLAYAEISRRDIFTGREPAPVQLPPPPTQRETTIVDRSPRQPAPPPPPPARLNTIVQALLTYPGKQEVVTYNTQTQERTVVAVGERLEGDCKLVTVHPYGAIGLDNGAHYLYPLDHTLVERERIEQDTHPLLWNWLHPSRNRPALHREEATPARPASAVEAEPINDVALELWDLLDEAPEPPADGDALTWQIPRGTDYVDLDHGR